MPSTEVIKPQSYVTLPVIHKDHILKWVTAMGYVLEKLHDNGTRIRWDHFRLNDGANITRTYRIKAETDYNRRMTLDSNKILSERIDLLVELLELLSKRIELLAAKRIEHLQSKRTDA